MRYGCLRCFGEDYCFPDEDFVAQAELNYITICDKVEGGKYGRWQSGYAEIDHCDTFRPVDCLCEQCYSRQTCTGWLLSASPPSACSPDLTGDHPCRDDSDGCMPASPCICHGFVW